MNTGIATPSRTQARNDIIDIVMSEKTYWVYILTNSNNSVLYTGVTSNLAKRMSEHASGKGSAFTKRYNVHKLVFAEAFRNVMEAILAEKKIKAGSRKKKIQLIESTNPEWKEIEY